MSLTTFLMTVLGLVVGALLGAGLYAWWLRRQASASLRLPAKWPLASRVLLRSEEGEVLNWLRATFPEHLVMIKLPVLRFTVPVDKSKNGSGQRWQELLNGVYCTFTVCTVDGHVVGCVDVPGKRGLGKANRGLKDALLSDCQIAYTVVRHTGLPKSSAMRAAFLGEIAVEEQLEHQPTRGGDSSFHADLDSFTRQKKLAAKEAALKELNKEEARARPVSQPAGFNPDGTGAFESRKRDRFSPQWEDSFTHADDSRRAKLS